MDSDFFKTVKAFLADRFDISNQLEELKDYKPIMGNRYAPRGKTKPLSIFEGEGLALYLFIQALQPRVVLELFTGTGLAAAYLGAGCPDTRVFSVDNYSEGEVGDDGWQQANDLIAACNLPNVTLIRGSQPELMKVLDANAVTFDMIDVLFLDGPYKDVSRVFQHEYTVMITHDEITYLGPAAFRLVGGSHLTFNVFPEMLPLCYEIFSPYFIMDVGEEIAWRPQAQTVKNS